MRNPPLRLVLCILLRALNLPDIKFHNHLLWIRVLADPEHSIVHHYLHIPVHLDNLRLGNCDVERRRQVRRQGGYKRLVHLSVGNLDPVHPTLRNPPLLVALLVALRLLLPLLPLRGPTRQQT